MRFSKASLSALFLASTIWPALAQDQAAHEAQAPKGAQMVRLAPIRQLRKGVDAWPLILNPSSPAEQHINATLTQMNDRLTTALHDCDDAYSKWVKVVGDSAEARRQAEDDWSRKISVTMRGPRYLSLVATDGLFCGGAHPDSDQNAIVFDLNTGETLDWKTSIAARVAAHSDNISDGSMVEGLILPALREMSISAAEPECKDAFDDPQSYLLWPDAQKERLVAQPFDMPHAVQACAAEIDLTMEQARKLGFSEDLLNAIREAHRSSGSREQ